MTGDVIRSKTWLLHSLGTFPTTTVYADFRRVRGVRLPFKMTIQDVANGTVEFRVQRIRPRLPRATNRFPAKIPRRSTGKKL